MSTNTANNSTTDTVSSIQFSDIFKLEDIQHLQDLFSDANGVASIITSPDGTPITNPSNFCRLCSDIIRKTEKGLANCLKSDAVLGCHNPAGPIVQLCRSGGLRDAGASISIGGLHIATWLIGQVRNEQLDEQSILEYADEIGADRDGFMLALNEVPAMSAVQFNKVSRLLFEFANQLSEKAYKNLLLKKQIDDLDQSTELLRESEESLSTILKFIGDAVITTDKSGVVTMMNPAAEQLTGWSIAEAKNKPFNLLFNIVDAATGKIVDNPVEKVIASGTITGTGNHATVISRDGEKYQIAGSAASIRDNQGNIETVILVFSDITEKYKAEEALIEAEWKFRALFEKGPIGVAYHKMIYDDSGKPIDYFFIDANESFRKLTGVDPRGKKVTQAFTGIENEPFDWIGTYGKVAQTGETIRFEQYLESSNQWYDCVAYRYKPDHFVAAFFEITKRKQAEEQVRLHAAISDISPLAINIFDFDGNILYANQRACEMHGYSKDEFMALNLRELNTPKSALLIESRMQEIFKAEAAFFEMEHRRKDGYTFPLEVYAKRTEWKGKQVLLSIGSDITERRRIELELIQAKEKAESANKLKDAFIANMSHEIRTPLNGILGMTSIIQEAYSQYAAAEEERFFTSIKRSSKRLINTVDKILNFSLMQIGDFPVKKTDISLSSVIEVLIREYNPLAAAKSLKIRFNSALEDDTVFADVNGLNTAFDNLIDNAIKFTEAGFIDISLYQDEKSKICIDIRDTGTGISDEYLKGLFEPYSQEGIGYSRPYEGLGLGLAITKKLFVLNGASISVKSKKGEGTAFTVCFNKQIAKQTGNNLAVEKEKEIKQRHLSKVTAGEKPCILIVEDDTVSQFYTQSILTKNYNIVIAGNAEKAIQLFNSRSFDLILMDISLSKGLNGLELTQFIRKGNINPNIPIIAVTGHAFPDDYRNAMEAGCNDFLTKPFQSFQLIEKIEKIIVNG